MTFRLLALLIFFVFNFSAYACSCIDMEVEKEYEKSDFIFKGIVKSIKPFGPTYFYRVEYLVFENYKNTTGKINYAYTHQSDATCGYSFKENRSYIVFGYISSSSNYINLKDKPMVTYCSLTLPLNRGDSYEKQQLIKVNDYLSNVRKDS